MDMYDQECVGAYCHANLSFTGVRVSSSLMIPYNYTFKHNMFQLRMKIMSLGIFSKKSIHIHK